jgi:hypothetical protein
MEKNGFTFWSKYKRAAAVLTDKKKLMYYEALIDMGLTGKAVETGDDAVDALLEMAAFEVLLSHTRVSAGASGGKAKTKKNTVLLDEAKEKKTPVLLDEPKPPKKDVLVDEPKDKDKDKDKDKESTTPTPPPGDAAAADVDPMFEEFWNAYPEKRRAHRREALQAYRDLKPDEQLAARIIQSVAEWNGSEEWAKEDGRFIPYPANFILKRRWEEKPTPRPFSEGDKWAETWMDVIKEQENEWARNHSEAVGS